MNLKSKALLAYVVIFLVGGASGYFLNEAISPNFPHPGFEHRPGMNNDFPESQEGKVPQGMKNFLIKRLDLQEDQIDPFFEIQSEHLEEFFSTIKDYRSKEIEKLRQMYSAFIDDIDDILTEEQIRELNSFAHPDSVHQRRMRRRGR